VQVLALPLALLLGQALEQALLGQALEWAQVQAQWVQQWAQVAPLHWQVAALQAAALAASPLWTQQTQGAPSACCC
jgi:hypothetical protein